MRYSDVTARRNESQRSEAITNVNDRNSETRAENHIAYNTYTQQYLDRFSVPQHNQHHYDTGRTVDQTYPKN